MNDRIQNYSQYAITEIIDAVVIDEKIDNLIRQKVDKSIQVQFDIIKQVLPKNHTYDLVYERKESRQIFLKALQQSQERLILDCPWLTNYAINSDVQDLLIAALDRGVSIDIGWGHNYMTSDTNSSEREVGIKTDCPETTDKLVGLFDELSKLANPLNGLDRLEIAIYQTHHIPYHSPIAKP